MIWICATCAVETADLTDPPAECAICSDERQWVPATGQAWTTLDALRAKGTRVTIQAVEPGLWGLRGDPEVGIGQQTMVVVTEAGTLLFDCIGYIDAGTVEFVRSLGPTLAVAASHPHMYGVQTEWAHALETCQCCSPRRTGNGCGGATRWSSSTKTAVSSPTG
ncbi:MAG TPA: hypothetical protein VFM07_07555 [Intrasporangium sp.]|nr:hypothetical protein [Intrasporangium sp.]